MKKVPSNLRKFEDIPFLFFVNTKIPTLVCFTVFRLRQPRIKIKHFGFVYQLWYLLRYTHCVLIWINKAILILVCTKRNIVKQTDVSIFYIHRKEKEICLFEFAQVRS